MAINGGLSTTFRFNRSRRTCYSRQQVKNPIFLSQIIFPNKLNTFYRPDNSLLQYSAELIIPARVSGIITSYFKYTFRKNTACRFSDAHQKYSGEPIQCNQETRHKYPIGGPWWVFLARQYTKYLTLAQSFLLWSPNFIGHPCKDYRSVPLGPAFPESFFATDSTTFSVISTGIKRGVDSYTYNATSVSISLPKPI